MKFSIPFLATRLDQLPAPGKYGHHAVEAILFNREELEEETWRMAWDNIGVTVRLYGPENVTFHFPVNDSDYVEEPFVLRRLAEALQRAASLGMHGVVIHANRVKEWAMWQTLDLERERARVGAALLELSRKYGTADTWLALENMPVMDNYGKQIDPLFVYPSDFAPFLGERLKVVWDMCHYTNTLSNVAQVLSGVQERRYYPNLQKTGLLDFLPLASHIVHWHFSAFIGICNPSLGTHCREGVLPTEGELGEAPYASAFHAIQNAAKAHEHVVFEIQEDSYVERKNVLKMIQWAELLHSSRGL